MRVRRFGFPSREIRASGTGRLLDYDWFGSWLVAAAAPVAVGQGRCGFAWAPSSRAESGASGVNKSSPSPLVSLFAGVNYARVGFAPLTHFIKQPFRFQ